MTVRPTKFGFTLPQRGVFFGVTTMARMMALATSTQTTGRAPDAVW